MPVHGHRQIDTDRGTVFYPSTSIPSDAAVGYAPGCIAQDEDATSWPYASVNEGTHGSAAFKGILTAGGNATISAAATDGIKISGACTDAIEISGECTYGINISAPQTAGMYYVANIDNSEGAWVHGVKVELTRTADVQPATGGWFGGQFVLNAGSSSYSALNKGTYVLQAVFKGSDTSPDGTDIHVARFETQSAGKVSDICYITANSGTTIVGHLLYLADHTGANGMLINVQSSQTMAKGISFLAGSGSTMTSLLYASGAGTFTNFLEVAATGDGGVTVGVTNISGDLTADAYLTLKVGSTSYKILAWAA